MLLEVNRMDKTPLIIKKRKNLKGEDGHKTFSVRIKDETVVNLDSIATQTGRTRNELVNIFLDYAIAHCEIEE